MRRGTPSWRNETKTRRWPSGDKITLELPTCVDRSETPAPRSTSRRVTDGGEAPRWRHGPHRAAIAVANATAVLIFQSAVRSGAATGDGSGPGAHSNFGT